MDFNDWLELLMTPDNATRAHAESQYNGMKESRLNTLPFQLLQCCVDGTAKMPVRKLAVVLLRRLLVKEEESMSYYHDLDPERYDSCC